MKTYGFKCTVHMLWWFFLFLLELLDLSADLFYTAATITGILLARPSLASFYTSLHLLQYFSLLLGIPIHLFYSKNLAKMPIAHLLHLFIHACILYNSSSSCLKPTHGVHFVITCICKLWTSPTIWENVFGRINHLSFSYDAKKACSNVEACKPKYI